MAKTKKTKKGKIAPNGVVLKTHENATIVFLTEKGFDIELIPKSNVKGLHTPDFIMNKIKWEMKSPKGEGNSVIKNTFQRAAKQSSNLIIDLRRVKRHQSKCLKEIEREFNHSKRINNLLIITKKGKLLDFRK